MGQYKKISCCAMRLKTVNFIVLLILGVILLHPGHLLPAPGQEKENRRAKVRELIEKAKHMRDNKEYYYALNALIRAFSLAEDKETRALVKLETAYVKYLRGNSYNIVKSEIEEAFDLNPGLSVDRGYEERFKRIFWEVREEKTGTPQPPPAPQEVVTGPGRKIPGMPPQDTMKKDKWKKNRLDLQYIYEYLSPHDVYGAWESYYIKYYRYEKPTFNFFIHGGMVKRDGKNDYIGLLGFAKDWSPHLYTYTVVAKGTVSTYLPNGRFDHDFNFKLGRKANILWTIGVTYIKYYVPAEDFIVSSGLTWYLERWVLGYRFFWNHKYPGDITSFTHLGSIEYGIDKSHWTAFSFSWGSQAYLALYVLTPEEIRQNALNIQLDHRQWISRGFGCFVWLGYLKLVDTYEKYLISAGIFFEF
jgi:YaiO family outer membrane protein